MNIKESLWPVTVSGLKNNSKKIRFMLEALDSNDPDTIKLFFWLELQYYLYPDFLKFQYKKWRNRLFHLPVEWSAANGNILVIYYNNPTFAIAVHHACTLAKSLNNNVTLLNLDLDHKPYKRKRVANKLDDAMNELIYRMNKRNRNDSKKSLRALTSMAKKKYGVSVNYMWDGRSETTGLGSLVDTLKIPLTIIGLTDNYKLRIRIRTNYQYLLPQMITPFMIVKPTTQLTIKRALLMIDFIHPSVDEYIKYCLPILSAYNSEVVILPFSMNEFGNDLETVEHNEQSNSTRITTHIATLITTLKEEKLKFELAPQAQSEKQILAAVENYHVDLIVLHLHDENRKYFMMFDGLAVIGNEAGVGVLGWYGKPIRSS